MGSDECVKGKRKHVESVKKKAKKYQEFAVEGKDVPVGKGEEKAAGKREKKKQKKVENDEKRQAGAGQSVQENVAEAQKKKKKQKKQKTEAAGASASGKKMDRELLDSVNEDLEKRKADEKSLHILAYCHLVPALWELHEQIIQPFQGLTAEEALDRLSDPSVSMTLARPSYRASRFSPTYTFTYVGRRTFPLLLRAMKESQRIDFRGHSGRGKSYLMAAMACYLHTYKDVCGSAVVYILMSRLIGNFVYLLEALLLAYAEDPETQVEILALSASEMGLLGFCRHKKLPFLMDEVNQLDNDKAMAGWTSKQRGAARSWQEMFYLRGVSCASDNSTTFQTVYERDSRLFLLNRPFDIDELSGWISATKKRDEEIDFHELTYYTGLIPWHLAFYAESKNTFIDSMQGMMDIFLLNLKEEDEAAVRKVLNGELEQLEGLGLHRDLFYERPFGKYTLVTVLPFLETGLRAEMDARRDDAALKQQKDRFKHQIIYLRGLLVDQSAEGLQPMASLNGWLAEGVTRDCMLLHKRCLDWEFQSSADYDDNRQVWKLDSLSADKLKQGVLFYPKAGTAKYADLHYVKLVKKTLKVRPVQIGVSSWKRKKVKDSHIGWELNAKKYWSRQGCTTQSKFTYLLSNALRQNLEHEGSKVTVKSFKHVHPCLDFLDDLRDPELELLRCKGSNMDNEQCGNVKFQVVYYCHDHLNQQPAAAETETDSTS